MLGSKKGRNKKSDRERERQDDEENSPDPSTGSGAVKIAREQIEALTEKECESITGIKRLEEGWRVRAVVAEVRRIPPTTDILACYEVELDDEGELQSCRQIGRYARSQVNVEFGGDGDRE